MIVDEKIEALLELEKRFDALYGDEQGGLVGVGNHYLQVKMDTFRLAVKQFDISDEALTVRRNSDYIETSFTVTVDGRAIHFVTLN